MSLNLLVVVVVSVLGPILTLNSSYHTMIYEITLDYQIAVGYQINVALGNFQKLINVAYWITVGLGKSWNYKET